MSDNKGIFCEELFVELDYEEGINIFGGDNNSFQRFSKAMNNVFVVITGKLFG